ncbi:ABC transporter permease [Amphibacillus xylanus]|uniref:Putative ABC transporter permease protein n=1 Tax=Amphibacillus xylanus (strain ATCC 51415 / DSM 6626 / JCM 7361 / LMG 17667 / NBRC 15112 / Ep01) TaxID=698758 RepID=K0IVE6_AMPXN|nr:ABC transporter permease [Amphibacillus xylanus]BAM46424.1 putative ABC transporter permease protein [Amphibacillus xylanus NBRC 15112]
MWSVFNLQWLRLKREPILALSFLTMTILFVFFIGGTQGEQTITVKTFSDQLSEAELDQWLDHLNDVDGYHFVASDRNTVEKQLQMSQISFALELNHQDYQYLVGQDSLFINSVNQHVEQVYRKQLRINEIAKNFPDQSLELQNYLQINSTSLANSVSDREEAGAHIVSGMTLYFALYTILFGMMNIAVEKRTGTWDRLIITPLKKSQIYVGQLLHYFLLGVLQIVICFTFFDYVLNYHFGDQYLSIIITVMAFVFAAVALGMLVISIVKSPQQLQAVIPIVSTAFAMLGGSYWPIELVTNKFLLALSKITPIYYGTKALKDAMLYNAGLIDILQPISILLLMGVIFMGVGLNLMERNN